ncbi:Bacterial protein of uncharacterised function (DUF853) [Moraxella caprae]|uniref:Bacterial protein of uncharacterized function (DUF853) n=2 Tax=Moraxella caprae TaxID=90240 RepID=A0A378R0E3_9GAMM|nr:Bacterial protein of uncharacterised function (DUF853) [Moraxella caprae]
MPNVVERAYILPPASALSPLTSEECRASFESDVLYRYYKDSVDNHSAFEALA